MSKLKIHVNANCNVFVDEKFIGDTTPDKTIEIEGDEGEVVQLSFYNHDWYVGEISFFYKFPYSDEDVIKEVDMKGEIQKRVDKQILVTLKVLVNADSNVYVSEMFVGKAFANKIFEIKQESDRTLNLKFININNYDDEISFSHTFLSSENGAIKEIDLISEIQNIDRRYRVVKLPKDTQHILVKNLNICWDEVEWQCGNISSEIDNHIDFFAKFYADESIVFLISNTIIENDGNPDNVVKYGFINKKKEIAIPIEYDCASDFYCGHSFVTINKTSFFIDPEGNRIQTKNYDEYRYFESSVEEKDGYFTVVMNGKCGVLNKNLEEIISCKYENIKYCYTNIWVKQRGKWGLIDKEDNVVVPFVFDEIKVNYANVAVRQNEKWGSYSPSGDEIISPKYIVERILDRYFIVKQNNKYGIYDSEFTEAFSCIYDEILYGDIDRMPYVMLIDHSNVSALNYLIVDLICDVECNEQYTIHYEKLEALNQWGLTNLFDITPLCKYENIKIINNELAIVEKDKLFGVITKQNEALLPIEYTNIQLIHDGNSFLVEKKGKKGFNDITCKEVLPCIYDDIIPYDEVIIVRLGIENQFYGLSDLKGAFLLPIKYMEINMDKDDKYVNVVSDFMSERLEINTIKALLSMSLVNEQRPSTNVFQIMNKTISISYALGKIGLPVVRGYIDGYSDGLHFILDTSSKHNTIDPKALNELGKYHGLKINEKIFIENEAIDLSLKIERESYEATFYVTSIIDTFEECGNLKIYGVLGIDFLIANKWIIDFDALKVNSHVLESKRNQHRYGLNI